MHANIDSIISGAKFDEIDLIKEEDDNNEVDLAKTFWLVLRKNKAQNIVLRQF